MTASGKSWLAMVCSVCGVDWSGLRSIAMLVPPGLVVFDRIACCASFCSVSSSDWLLSSAAVAASKIPCATMVARADSDSIWSRRCE
ncbi:hypothetical protein [Curtobacterium sp. 24E2]